MLPSRSLHEGHIRIQDVFLASLDPIIAITVPLKALYQSLLLQLRDNELLNFILTHHFIYLLLRNLYAGLQKVVQYILVGFAAHCVFID